MALFDKKKYEHKKAQVGHHIGAQSKLDSYVYGREKSKKISMSRAINHMKEVRGRISKAKGY